jgi:hypothetical protein
LNLIFISLLSRTITNQSLGCGGGGGGGCGGGGGGKLNLILFTSLLARTEANQNYNRRWWWLWWWRRRLKGSTHLHGYSSMTEVLPCLLIKNYPHRLPNIAFTRLSNQ